MHLSCLEPRPPVLVPGEVEPAPAHRPPGTPAAAGHVLRGLGSGSGLRASSCRASGLTYEKEQGQGLSLRPTGLSAELGPPHPLTSHAVFSCLRAPGLMCELSGPRPGAGSPPGFEILVWPWSAVWLWQVN